VDDEPGMLLVISRILESAGYTVHTAENAQMGLEIVRKIHPDVVLLDIRLPDMDGPELLKEIKKIYPEIPIVMCSGFGDVETAVQTVKQGASDYISKPFKNEEVLKVVKNVLTQQIAERVKPVPVREEIVLPARKPVGWSKLLIPAGLGLVLIGVIVFVILKIVFPKSSTPSVFSVPYSHPTALTFDGENLWVSSWFTQTIYKHKLDNSFTVGGSYYFPTLHPTGLSWGDNCLWTCDPWTRKIYRHNLDTTLSIVDSYDSPGTNPSGLYWDGINLWSVDATEDRIYKHKLDERLSVITVYDSPGPSPIGIFSDGKGLWTADSETNKIYKHELDNKLTIVGFSTPEAHQQTKLTGMTGGSKYLWTVSEDTGKIYQYNIKTMKFTH
ncbi:MAG TPA: hypothetical protein DHV62_10905, partial [Elusimicrobia bacterium]|nr:hypothetical protein [Elusimicrobiota bacterium]